MSSESMPEYHKIPEGEVPNAFIGAEVDMSDWSDDDHARYDARIWAQDEAAKAQIQAEKSYTIDASAEPYEAQLTPVEVISKLEYDHVVKEANSFENQVNDLARTNKIACVVGLRENIGSSGHESKYDDRRVEMSEHDALKATYQFFEAMAYVEEKQYQDDINEYGEEEVTPREEFTTFGDDMRKHLTFIGEKELQEASAGLADYWKALLESNPNQQLYIPIGEIIKSTFDEALDKASMVKSDKYVFDHIMAHFSEEERTKYANRLVTEQSAITVDDPESLRIILLDDWAISGSQLVTATDTLRMDLPQFASRIEVNLIVATEDQITHGLARTRNDTLPGMATAPLPVRAYFKSHHTDFLRNRKAYITGAHSSVDYGFSEEIEESLKSLWFRETHGALKLPDSLRSTPPLMNIVRPYRQSALENEQKE